MNITLTLTEQQTQNILQFADAAVRTGGLQFVRQAVELMDLIDEAVADSAPSENSQTFSP